MKGEGGSIAALIAETKHLIKLPRFPRGRAAKRPVADIGFEAGFTEIKSCVLNKPALVQLARLVPNRQNTRALWQGLQELAGDYLRWLDQPQPSKEETTYQLKVIRLLAESELNGGTDSRARAAELRRRWIAILNEDASFRFNIELKSLVFETAGRLANATAVDPSIVFQAAVAAHAKCARRGDYPDPSLHLAILQLIDLFEACSQNTGDPFKITSHTVGVGPVTAAGTRRQVADSALSNFITEFFAQVGTPVEKTKITGALKAIRKSRAG